ncbi:hypothetical protein GCM10027275_37590 [Rhabdobacter roseus]|uniref:Uncharacterized protein n=1 Tax=Rhabdobacter roseus TaxID=1655419 RepID=A0A840TW75_9BACT|nr:hypothetical protein [Rhabdobacter roseus]MBB5285832.1 hypothetical protein [Rhabdobacter roseus]
MKNILKNSIFALALISSATLASANNDKDSIRTAQPVKESPKTAQIEKVLPRYVATEDTQVLPQAKLRTLPTKRSYSPEQKAALVELSLQSTR